MEIVSITLYLAYLPLSNVNFSTINKIWNVSWNGQLFLFRLKSFTYRYCTRVRLHHFGQVCMAAMNVPGTFSVKNNSYLINSQRRNKKFNIIWTLRLSSLLLIFCETYSIFGNFKRRGE
jgi:hypothetical protein